MNIIKNYFSTLLFIWCGYLFYSQNSTFTYFFETSYHLEFWWWEILWKNIIHTILLGYVIGLPVFYYFERSPSKAWILLEYLKNIFMVQKRPMNQNEKIALLSWAVKLFFAPLMVHFFSGHVFSLINGLYNASFINNMSWETLHSIFETQLFLLFFSLILFFDVLFFTLWYLLEWNIFKNKILSVDSTFFWWIVALASYPPFNQITTTYLWWHSQDMAVIQNSFLYFIANISILLLMGLYASASVSLWLKASNLTYRWVVDTGLYKYVRHPAYICKNMAWWIGGLPFLLTSLTQGDFKSVILIFLSLSAWSTLYFLRAYTEEMHLSQFDDYIAYKKKVRYRFIPNII